MGLQKELEAKNLDGVIRELTENPSCIDDVTEKVYRLLCMQRNLEIFLL
mgnify:CR=1 FL=1